MADRFVEVCQGEEFAAGQRVRVQDPDHLAQVPLDVFDGEEEVGISFDTITATSQSLQ